MVPAVGLPHLLKAGAASPELGVHEDVADALRVLLSIPKVAHFIHIIDATFEKHRKQDDPHGGGSGQRGVTATERGSAGEKN